MLASESGLFETAERHVGIDEVVAVHPDGAGADPGDQPLHCAQVVRPDARTQAVRGVIRQDSESVEIIEPLRDQHGPEDFLANDPHVGADTGKHGGLDIVARCRGRLAAGENPGALLPARLDITEHALLLLPSSSETRFRVSVADLLMSLPTEHMCSRPRAPR